MLSAVAKTASKAAGIEPVYQDSEAHTGKEFLKIINELAAVWQRKECVYCQELAQMDTDMRNEIESIAKASPLLDSNIRTAILALTGER